MSSNNRGWRQAIQVDPAMRCLGPLVGLFGLLLCVGCGGGNITTPPPPPPVPAKISATIAVGTAPRAIAVDTGNNKVVVVDAGGPETALYTNQWCKPTGSDVTLIDGASETTTASTFNFPENPYAVLIDPASHVALVLGTEYLGLGEHPVCNVAGAALSGPGDASTAGPMGQLFLLSVGRIDVNPQTEKIYLTRPSLNGVLVLNGVSYSGSTTIAVGTHPNGIAVNAITNKIYVANGGSNDISVIDGATNSVTTVADPTAAPVLVAVNHAADKIYVSHSGSNNITVIDGSTNAVSTVADPNATNPVMIVANTTTNKIYVANGGSNNVSVIDGATNSTSTIPAGTSPAALAVDDQRNVIYVANAGNSQKGDPGNITVIDGATNATSTLTDPKAQNPISVAVNPATNKAYIANIGSNNVTMVDGSHD